ncbi:SDR family oxidoreductase [Prochlorococcus sp. MIT 1307]|uniref:SDR family oxidoreductase n=1 Tax=Prochlorococcus sp. MIT 1307 TaxID=3096219 RepID=UPI002A75F64E|nr:SDR family oxidoreductase [Prochlorococcus sp. MIT 1307]
MSTVLITGASRGIGKAAAKLFAKAGWDLLLVARSNNDLQLLTEELTKTTVSTIRYKSIDLSDPAAIALGVDELVGNGVSPAVLINNAGVAWTGELLSMSLERWQWVFQMNVTSVFQVCSAVVPLMRSSGGLIINVSSHAARNAFPQWGAYCITKAALASFTKCLAEEERMNGIRACTLTIGSVNSTLWDTDTVQSDFDRNSMLTVENAASALLYMAEQPSSQVIEDLTLMPATGAF